MLHICTNGLLYLVSKIFPILYCKSNLCCSPKFAVIVVKKRINARFFLSDRNQVSNPPPGTIIDQEATRPEWYNNHNYDDLVGFLPRMI